MTIKTRREILKEWGIIKSQKDFEIFRKLQNTPTKEKQLKYGLSIVKTIQELTKLKETNQVRRAIKRMPSKERRILIGDTYLVIIAVYQNYQEECEHRLIDLCTKTQKDCTFLNCPELQSIDLEEYEEEVWDLLPEDIRKNPNNPYS